MATSTPPELDPQILAINSSLSSLFEARIRLLLKLGRIPDVFKTLRYMQKSLGPTDPKARDLLLGAYIELDQIDRVLAFDWANPGYEAKVADYIAEFDKRNPEFPHSHPYTKRHVEFVRWIRAAGGNVDLTVLRIYAENARGLHANVDIKVGQSVLQIPMQGCGITPESFAETEMGKRLDHAQSLRGKLRDCIFPVLYLLLDPHKQFAPWISILPRADDVFPMFYTANASQEKTLLRGSSTLALIEKQRRTLRLAYEKIATICPEFAATHPFAEFLRICVVCASRTFALPIGAGVPTPCLVPYADMANGISHEKENIMFDYDPEKEACKFVALEPIAKGQEIVLSYGHRSNFSYFVHYGYTLDPGEYDAAGFVLDFQGVANADLKRRLLGLEQQGYKVAKFYANSRHRKLLNAKFMACIRFYWSEAPAEKLRSSVRPPAVSSGVTRKRTAAMSPENAAGERAVLVHILSMAQEALAGYGTISGSVSEESKWSVKCCVREVEGEKRALNALIEMAALGTKLLDMESAEKAREYYAKIGRAKENNHYIEKELLALKW